MMGKPIHLIAGYKQSKVFFLFCLFLNAAVIMGTVLAQCPSSFLLRANINKKKYYGGYEKEKKLSNVRFLLEYMWHVMVHCKHSRLAKALSDQSHSKRQRGHSPASHWVSFSLLSFGGASFQRASRSRGRGRTAGQPCNEGEGSSCPLLLSIHKLVCFFFFFFTSSSCSWPRSASNVTACPS